MFSRWVRKVPSEMPRDRTAVTDLSQLREILPHPWCPDACYFFRGAEVGTVADLVGWAMR